MVTVDIIVNFTKTIAFFTLLAGTLLSYHTMESAYFLAACGVCATVITGRDVGNAFMKSKTGNNENNPIDSGGVIL